MNRSRRHALAGIAAALGAASCARALGQPADRAAYVAVETAAQGGLSRARLLTATGAEAGRVPLGFRAHGLARHGARLAVFPRRPGDRFALVDAATLELGAPVTAPEGRHFYGHGAFDAEGGLLAVPENDLGDLSGWLALYAVDGLRARRLDALPLPRPGPHEVLRADGGFHVALGGLMTHPDYGRAALNLDGFVSEVVALGADGRAEPLGLRSEGVSLRHLARDGRGRLYVGGQRPPGVQGAGPVLWVLEGGRAEPVADGGRLGGYVSSVAAWGAGAVATSKVAGRALRLDGARILGEARLDGASAAALGPGLDAVSGHATLRLGGAELAAPEGFEFDNHGLSLA